MSEVACKHCQTPFTPSEREPDFCCQGCRFVNQLILGEGLDDFYHLQDGLAGRPVGERPFEEVSTRWLEELLEEEHQGSQTSLRLRISGVTCVGCVWLIERLFMAHEGAVRASIFPATAEAEFTWQSGTNPLLDLARELPKFGYVLENPAEASLAMPESRRLVPRLGLCAAFAMNTMAFALPRYLGMSGDFAYAGLFDLVALLSATLTLLVGGSYFFAKAIAGLRLKTIHIDLPISLGLAAAYLGSLAGWFAGDSDLLFFDFVATFTVLMLGGRFLHLSASERAQSQLQGQSAIGSEVQLTDGSKKRTLAVQTDDRLLLDPGQPLPVAARLVKKTTEFSLAWMTGEAEPQTFKAGSLVPSGAINLARESIEVIAAEDHRDSLVARLTREASEERPDALLQKILRTYLAIVLVVGIATGIGWAILGAEPLTALQRMISVFIVSCPCAIGVAIPLADRRAASAMAKQGVFVQKPGLWPKLSRVVEVIFDKTGTLTLEHPKLLAPLELDHFEKESLQALAALTRRSLHPLSRSLARELPMEIDEVEGAKEVAGCGSVIEIDGIKWSLGKPGWRGLDRPAETVAGNLACELCRNGKPIHRFEFHETLRPQARQALAGISRNRGLHIFSGDARERVARLAKTLEIAPENAHGSMSPEEKETLVKSLGPSLYLGDGINDSLAFSAATVTGTPVADRSLLDQRSHFLFTCPGLSFLPDLFQMANWRRQTVRLIVIFTIFYNLAAVSACIIGYMTPLVAAILMPASSLISLAIARRRMFIRSESQKEVGFSSDQSKALAAEASLSA